MISRSRNLLGRLRFDFDGTADLIPSVLLNRGLVSAAISRALGRMRSGGGTHPFHRAACVVRDQSGAVVGARYGPVLYQFQRGFTDDLREVSDGQFRFELRDFCAKITAEGAEAEEAEGNWCAAFHGLFQRMRREYGNLRDVKPGADLIARIRECVDVATYDSLATITVEQAGRVSDCKPEALKVRWIGEDGDGEWIPLVSARPEFAGYRRGDRFRSVVERDREWAFVELLHCALVPEEELMSPETMEHLVEALPGTASTAPLMEDPFADE